MDRSDLRWWLALALTFLIIALQVGILWNIASLDDYTQKRINAVLAELGKVHKEVKIFTDKPLDTSGITPAQMKDLRFKLDAIERFVRTTPLVECGNTLERKK